MALVDGSSNEVKWEGALLAPQGASGASLALLEQLVAETGISLDQVELFAADIGPGSFTGVRVGVTLAKTFGYLYSKPVAGANSFDLVSAKETVVLPSKKGEFFIRRVGELAFRSVDLPSEPYVGFGPSVEPKLFPSAARFADLIGCLVPVDAALFVPEYLIEPSISTPKKPYHPISVKDV